MKPIVRRSVQNRPEESDVFVFASGDGGYLVRPADFVARRRVVRLRNFTALPVRVVLRRPPWLASTTKGGPALPLPLELAEGERADLEIPELLPAGVYEMDVWVDRDREFVRAAGHSSPRIIVDP